MKNDYILSFHEIDQRDLARVGGKGANLGEMVKAGFPVPYGFCVTTNSYRAFIEDNHLAQFISEVLKDANPDNIHTIGSQIRGRIGESEITSKVKQEIIKAVRQRDTYYAVRSSATAEDLPFASFAGQQDTYLNVRGEEALLDAVRSCWASLFTNRAILYRIQNNIDHEKVQMAVVIQEMVFPEVSGIMFTADPVSGHRDIVSIDASYGLGEALVAGLVSPDVYKFNKRTGQIVSKSVAEKKMAIMPMDGGGTKKIEITGAESSRQVLDDAQVKNLAELGMAIEKHYASPQDIEWCLAKGQFYIVQSRAITSLFPLPEPIPEDQALHVYVSFNHFQVMTDPISPLGIDMLRLIASFDPGARSAEEYQHMKSAAGRIYIDLSALLKNRVFRKGFPEFLKNADALMAEALLDLINRPDFDARIQQNPDHASDLLRFMRPVLINAIKNVTYRDPEGVIESINSYIEERIRKAEDEVKRARPGIERLEAIYRAARFTQDFRFLLPRLLPGFISFKGLEALEQRWLGTRQYTDLIVKGLEGNITTEMGLLTGDVADLVRTSPALVREFENQDYSTLLTRIDQLQGHEEFKQKFKAFMTRYDMRAAGEIDVAKDRWIENPEPLARSILAIVKTGTEGAHRQEYRETIERAKQAAVDLCREVETRHGKLKGKIIRRLISVVRNYLPAREHPKYLIMKLLLIFKKALLEEARMLVQNGQLVREKDIFYVSFWELYKAIQNRESLLELVERRKAEYTRFRKLNAPRILTSEGEEIKGSYQRKDLPASALAGMPVSSGVIEGIAHVITDPANASLGKGEILVAPFTDPGWTPLFINAAGLVMEIGGLLTHGTVVAREYGIPAVVGITDATKKIKTGQKIRVDGNAGFVLVIEE
jgi:phosphoenolpyruvate synthase/pyruvate phosphate dikinase